MIQSIIPTITKPSQEAKPTGPAQSLILNLHNGSQTDLTSFHFEVTLLQVFPYSDEKLTTKSGDWEVIYVDTEITRILAGLMLQKSREPASQTLNTEEVGCQKWPQQREAVRILRTGEVVRTAKI